MHLPKQEDYIFYQGAKFQVEFYYTERGELLAKEYLLASDRIIKAKLSSLIKRIAENGTLFDKEKFRVVDKKEKVFEFKPASDRFFNFFAEGERIIITNAYRKKTQGVDPREISRAINFKKDYEFRVKEGTYYADC